MAYDNCHIFLKCYNILPPIFGHFVTFDLPFFSIFSALRTLVFLCISAVIPIYIFQQIKEGGEGQSTQLMLNYVIFSKLHVSAERGHLQVSHLYRGKKLYISAATAIQHPASPLF
jgi:hypothetical protein